MIVQSNLYQTLFEETSDGIVLISANGQLLHHNQSAAKLVGYDFEEFSSINFEELLVEKPKFDQTIKLVNKNQSIRDIEIQLVHKQGHTIHCLFTAFVENGFSEDASYLIILRDISQQIITEQALNDRLRLEAGISAATGSLLSDSDAALCRALHQLMQAADVSGVHMLMESYKPDGALFYKLTHEVNAGDPPDKPTVVENGAEYETEFFLTAGFDQIQRDFANKKESVIYASSLSGEALETFQSRNIKSLLFLPIQVQKRWPAFLLFSDTEQERNWSEHNIELLHTAASVIGTFLSRKKSQEELKNQRLFLRQVIDLNPEFVFVKDKNGRYTLVNQAFANRYNLTPDQFIGKTDEELNLSANKVKSFRDADLSIFESSHSQSIFEDKVVFPDGTAHWLQTTKRPILNTDDEATHLVAISVDMTEQKQGVELIQERERFLETILNSLPAAVFWKDKDSVYLGSNKFFSQFCGIEPDALVGKTDRDLPWKSGADSFIANDAKVMADGESQLGLIERRLLSDGSEAWLESNKIALKDQNGEVYGVLGTLLDITDRIYLQEQSQQSLDKRSRQVEFSTQIAQDIADATDLSQLYEEVVVQVKELFGYYHVQLLQYDPALDTIVLTAGYGEAGQKMLEMNHALPMGVGLIGTAAESGDSVLRPFISKDLNWRANPLLPETKGEIAVPIKSKTKILGVLDVQSDVAGALSEEDQLMLEGLCGQIAIAIESTNLRQELESQLNELVVLQQRLSHEAWTDYQESYDETHIGGFQYDHLGIRPLSPSDTVLSEFKPQGEAGKQEIVSKPVEIRGQVIGYMGVKEANAMPLDQEEQAFLDAVATEVAGALEAARLFEEIEKSLQDQARLATELETVAQVSTAAATVLDSDYLLQSVVDLVKESFELYHAHIYLVTERGDYLELSAGSGTPGQLMALEGHKISINANSLVAKAARNRDGILENDVRKTVDFLPNPMLPNTQAEIALPMIVGDKIIGVMDMQADEAFHFSESDLRIFGILASQIAVAHENAQQYSAQVATAKKLREVDQLKSEFLASMSHELRTPLNSIIGFADVLLEGLDGELNERMDEDVRLIRQSGAHLRELIGDILDMSKIEAGKMELRYEIVNLVQMAEDIMKTAHPLAQAKSLELLFDLDESIDDIPADRTRLRQVLWNIMGNAIKFTEKGSVTLRIASKADHLLVSVKDTGIGISESHIPIVFEQFRQVDGSLERVAGGAGLGMPISKRLVELHGGRIWAESVMGQGSTFFFTLPYVKPEVAPE